MTVKFGFLKSVCRGVGSIKKWEGGGQSLTATVILIVYMYYE